MLKLSLGDKHMLVQSLWHMWSEGGFALDHLPTTIARILETEAWRDREIDGKRMCNGTFREFIVSPPLKGCGWEKQIPAIEKVLAVKDLDVLRRWREAMTQHGGKHDNVMLEQAKTVQGNSLSYTLSRLLREHPKLYKRVIAGELSANAAAIEAGFRKRSTPIEQIRKLLPKLTSEQRAQLRREL